MSGVRVTLGVQAGDSESNAATSPAYMPLRQLLAANCVSEYSAVIREFAIVLRISGSIWSFEGEGVQRLRIRQRQASVTADFVVPEIQWRERSFPDFRMYLATGVIDTLAAMCRHLEIRKLDIQTDLLMKDARGATAKFLALKA